MTDPYAAFRGTAYLARVDPDQRAALEAWEMMLRLGEAGTVDCEHFIDTQLYLTPETAKYIYSDYTPTEVRYERGSRPGLEAVFKGLGLAPEMPDYDKFLWIARFVRDLPARHNWTNGLPFTGGTEEELIAKGASMCNEKSRVMIALCQAAGLPARYIGHHIGGHGVSEAYVDGRWAYFDNRGVFFLLDPESRAAERGAPSPLAGTWEVWQDRGLIRRQPPWVTREVLPRARRVALRDDLVIDDPCLASERTYFHPKEGTSVTNYFIWEAERFNYAHPTGDPDGEAKSAALWKVRSDVQRRLGMAESGLYNGHPLPDWAKAYPAVKGRSGRKTQVGKKEKR